MNKLFFLMQWLTLRVDVISRAATNGSSCSSRDRAGCLLIGRSLVRIPAHRSYVSRCPWARHRTPNCSWCALHGHWICYEYMQPNSGINLLYSYMYDSGVFWNKTVWSYTADLPAKPALVSILFFSRLVQVLRFFLPLDKMQEKHSSASTVQL